MGYKDAVLASEPWRYWTLENIVGNYTDDSSAQQGASMYVYNYWYSSQPVLTPDSTNANRLDGGYCYGNQSNFANSLDLTLEMVVVPTQWWYGNYVYYGLYGYGNGFYGRFMNNGSAWVLKFKFRSDATEFTSTATFDLNKRYHIVVTYTLSDGSTNAVANLYVNGVKQTFTDGQFTYTGIYNCYFGYDYNWYQFYGELGHIAYYRRAITDAEVQAHYDAMAWTYGASLETAVGVANTTTLTQTLTTTALSNVDTTIEVVPSVDPAALLDAALDFAVQPSAELGQVTTVNLDVPVRIDTITPRISVQPISPPVVINPPSGMPTIPVDPSKRKAPVIRTVRETYPTPTLQDGRPV